MNVHAQHKARASLNRINTSMHIASWFVIRAYLRSSDDPLILHTPNTYIQTYTSERQCIVGGGIYILRRCTLNVLSDRPIWMPQAFLVLFRRHESTRLVIRRHCSKS